MNSSPSSSSSSSSSCLFCSNFITWVGPPSEPTYESTSPSAPSPPPDQPAMVQNPIHGQRVPPERTRPRCQEGGSIFSFCPPKKGKTTKPQNLLFPPLPRPFGLSAIPLPRPPRFPPPSRSCASVETSAAKSRAGGQINGNHLDAFLTHFSRISQHYVT